MIPEYKTIKLNTVHLRGIRSVANGTRLGRGLRKELATRVRVKDDFQSLNMHLTSIEGDDDLWDHEPVDAFKGTEVHYASDGIIEIDVWLYDRDDDLQGQVSVYGLVCGGNQVHWQESKPHRNDVLRANVLKSAGKI